MTVSVIIPMFNREAFIAATLESVLLQGDAASEVIVVDDGSTDDSIAIVQGFGAPIRLVTQPHTGISAARNLGFREATGDLISYIDSDDLWPVGRLPVMKAALEADDGADAVAGRVEIIEQRTHRPPAIENYSTAHRLYNLGSVLFRRQVFERIGVFDESLSIGEDFEFAMRARQAGVKIKLLDVVSLIYRLHDGNISGDVTQNQHHMLAAMHLSRLRRPK
jgi:glycosyltransferase involved in cell wall biosynthesis